MKLLQAPRRALLGMIGIALAMASGCSNNNPVTPPVSPSWRKFSGNPVLEAGPPGSWDADGVGAACVRNPIPGTYVMWYTGSRSAGKSIGIAWSDDGVGWTKDPRNPVFTPGAAGTWDAAGVGSPCVLTDGTSYLMYYTGTNFTSQGIGRATSGNGILWTRTSDGPVLAPSVAGTAWDDDAVYTPWVLRAGTGFEMWYGGRGTDGSGAIGRATSTDGIYWTRYLSPVLDPQVLEAVTYGPCVLHSGTMYRLWCVASHEAPGGTAFPRVIDYAQSFDGIEWTWNRLALSPGTAAAWDGGSLLAVCVLDQGADTRMWYEGRSVAGRSAIGLAIQP